MDKLTDERIDGVILSAETSISALRESTPCSASIGKRQGRRTGDDDGQKLEDGHDRVMEEMDPVVGMASSDEEEEETDGGYQSNSKREWKDERRVKVVRSAVSSVAEMPLEEQNAKEAVDGDKEGDKVVEGGFIDPADIQR